MREREHDAYFCGSGGTDNTCYPRNGFSPLPWTGAGLSHCSLVCSTPASLAPILDAEQKRKVNSAQSLVSEDHTVDAIHERVD